jgi:hypothetical protein
MDPRLFVHERENDAVSFVDVDEIIRIISHQQFEAAFLIWFGIRIELFQKVAVRRFWVDPNFSAVAIPTDSENPAVNVVVRDGTAFLPLALVILFRQSLRDRLDEGCTFFVKTDCVCAAIASLKMICLNSPKTCLRFAICDFRAICDFFAIFDL